MFREGTMWVLRAMALRVATRNELISEFVERLLRLNVVVQRISCVEVEVIIPGCSLYTIEVVVKLYLCK